jgi:ribonuclease P protein component
MLAAEHRLRHKKDFETTFTKGLKAYGQGLGLRYTKRYKPDVPTRFGFIVGTKVSKESVVRNRLKRRMREVVRAFIARVPVGFDVVITAFPEGKDLDFAGVKAEIEKMLTKATLLR